MKSAPKYASAALILGALFPQVAHTTDIVVSTPIFSTVDLSGNSLSVTSTGSITASIGAQLQNSTGDFILNNGEINGSVSAGVAPASDGTVNFRNSTLSGSITNYGLITNAVPSGSGYAINLDYSSVISGSLINYGTISATGGATPQAIRLGTQGINKILGGIINYGSITSSGPGPITAGIRLNGDTIINGGITNSGLISSSSKGIATGGTIDFIKNTGNISGNSDGIYLSNGAIGTITNSGNILGGSGYSINNSANRTIGTINNGQGLNGSGGSSFTYAGRLPNNYNIITNGSRYGQLQAFSAVAPAATTMTFGISSASSLQALTYGSVLSGVADTLINPTSLTGSFGSYTWSLLQTATGSGIWNLFVFSYDISSGGTFLASNIGTNFNPIFAGGTLEMNQQNAIYSQNFSVNSSSTNTIDQYGNTSTFTGVFSNAAGQTGNIVVTNSGNGGKVIFAGANTYTGSTTILNGATVAINGSMLSNMIVNAGGTLQGSGSFGGGVISGILAPGNSIGAITSNGNLTFASGSTYAVEVDAAGNSDKTVVNGTANIQGGTVAVSGSLPATPLALSKTKYTILTATNGVSGRFAGVSGLPTFSFLTGGLTYGANDVTLGYNFATPFSTVAKNINQRNVGNALTLAALGSVNALGAPILNALFLGNYQNAQAVMDTVSGSGLAGVQSTAMQVGEMASSAVSDQIAFWRSGETYDATGVTSQEGNNSRSYLAYAPVETSVKGKGPINIKGLSEMAAYVTPRTYRAWGSMFGGGANYLSDAGRGSAASNLGYYGGLVGVDYQVQPNLLLGAALGGSSANFNVGSLSTNGALTGFHAGLYGSYAMGASYVALNETFSAYNNQTTRKAGGYALMPYEQLSATFGSTEFRTRLEGGHTLLMGGLKATPFVAGEIAAYQSNFFAEKSTIVASTFALKNNGQSVNSLPTFIGLRLSNGYTLANGWRVAPIGSVAYVHEFFPQRQFTNILMSMPGTDFNVSGPRSTYNLVQTKLGAQLNLTNQLALFSDFQGEFSSMSQSYGGKAGMKYWW